MPDLRWPHTYAEQIGQLAKDWLMIWDNMHPEHLGTVRFEDAVNSLAGSLVDPDLTGEKQQEQEDEIASIIESAIEKDVEESIRINHDELRKEREW